jgi:hypothetical protein
MVPVKNTRYVAKYSPIRKETKLADVKKHFIDIISMSSSANYRNIFMSSLTSRNTELLL